MITRSLDGAAFFRMLSPRWSWAPTSGDGAALQGGRLNRKGTPALYLADRPETAIAEYQQASALLPPGMLVNYEVTLDKVVDFSNGYAPDWDPLWQDLGCDWRKLVFADNLEPPTWVIADHCQKLGFKGIIFPSAALAGGFNLVVFTSSLEAADSLSVFDPRGDLPRDQASWKEA